MTPRQRADRSGRFRRWSWFAIAALVVVALVRNTVDEGPARTTEDRVHDIASTMKCPICAGQSVADSDVAAARGIRLEIARRVEAGEPDDEIRDAIAATYGDDLQLTPRGRLRRARVDPPGRGPRARLRRAERHLRPLAPFVGGRCHGRGPGPGRAGAGGALS